jgi:TfoX/Sxy family transcriptional regulator of competence genes
MPYDQDLAQRIRAVLHDVPGLQEKKMFGGVGFIIRGNMACGVNGDTLIVRVGPDKHQAALAKPHTAF